MACRVLAQTVPVAMLPVSPWTGGTVGAAVVPPYQFSLQLPACATVLNGSVVVFATVTPVSKPAWLVTYGYNKMVRQMLTVKILPVPDPVVAAPVKRGMVNVLDATADVAVGAKLRVTVGGDPAGKVLAEAVTETANLSVSTAFGSVFTTSPTAEPVWLLRETSAIGTLPEVAVSVEVMIGKKPLILPSGEVSPLTSRSEEHTSELQSRQYLVCRLLLEK